MRQWLKQLSDKTLKTQTSQEKLVNHLESIFRPMAHKMAMNPQKYYIKAISRLRLDGTYWVIWEKWSQFYFISTSHLVRFKGVEIVQALEEAIDRSGYRQAWKKVLGDQANKFDIRVRIRKDYLEPKRDEYAKVAEVALVRKMKPVHLTDKISVHYTRNYRNVYSHNSVFRCGIPF